MDESIDTLPGLDSADAPSAQGGSRVPCLTLMHHPDLRRVGQRVFVRAGETLEVSRRAPELRSPRGERPAAPLDDAHISRVPVLVEAPRDGGLRIVVTGEHRARLGGQPIEGEVRLGVDALRDGVALELNARVQLLVHQADPSSPSGSDTMGVIGASAGIESARRAIRRVAPTSAPVLLTGESGVGKELVARALHLESGRTGRFVPINVGRLNPSTAASELFGHTRGAFTGASADHEGLITRGDQGTLFLDEVGEAHLDVQAMLLRVLETGEVLAMGASGARDVDFRLVSATDADLAARVEEGRLRRALYHRLAGFTIPVAPLRERRDDIPRLVVHFLAEVLEELGHSERLRASAGAKPWLHREVMRRLVRHAWPGNVRQLRNVVRQLAIAHAAEPRVRWGKELETLLGEASEEEARSLPASAREDDILEVLEQNGWAFGPTARALGMNRTTFYRLVEERPDVRTGSQLSREEIVASLERCGGDLTSMSKELRVSARAIGRRMRELEIPRP